jgi:hypothetical protein
MTLPLLLLVAALQGSDRPACGAEVQWIVKPEQPLGISRSAPLTPLTLFSAVGYGCGSADIRLTAVYVDGAENVVCSGAIAGVIGQSAGTQVTVIELRPTSLFEFLRWRSGPRATALTWRPLICSRPDGQGDVQPGELERATTLRLYATVLPSAGGVATEMLRLTLVP